MVARYRNMLLLTKALSNTIFPDMMQRCDILRYINFGEISCSFWKKSFVGIHRLCCQALPLYHRSTAYMSSLIIRHFQFLFKSPKTHVTFEQNVIFRTLFIYKRTKCKVYISEIRGVKTTKTLKTWWRDVNNVTWVFGLSHFCLCRHLSQKSMSTILVDCTMFYSIHYTRS